MKIYTGTFTKKDGTLRKMNFVKLEDIPAEFLAEKISGDRKAANTAPGMELVYDLESDNFRYFNWDTIVDKVKEIEVKENIFNK